MFCGDVSVNFGKNKFYFCSTKFYIVRYICVCVYVSMNDVVPTPYFKIIFCYYYFFMFLRDCYVQFVYILFSIDIRY